MVELDNLKTELNDYTIPLKEIHDSLNIDAKEKRLNELEMIMQESDFWNDVVKANNLTKEAKSIRDLLSSYEYLKNSYDDLIGLIDIANEENDEKLLPEIKDLYKDFTKKVDSMRTTCCLVSMTILML